jgi:hypothetical protein
MLPPEGYRSQAKDRVNQMSAPELEIATREALDRDHRLRSGSQSR